MSYIQRGETVEAFQWRGLDQADGTVPTWVVHAVLNKCYFTSDDSANVYYVGGLASFRLSSLDWLIKYPDGRITVVGDAYFSETYIYVAR
jgi:hypothetical protein